MTNIGDDAFEECDALTIYGPSGSYAETYAKMNSIPYKLLTEDPAIDYRQTYEEDKYNATISYDGEIVTATLTDPDLKPSYLVNQKGKGLEEGDLEHMWHVDFSDGTRKMGVSTSYWLFYIDRPSEERTLQQMQNSIFLKDDNTGMYSIIENVKTSVSTTETTITWKFTMPKELNFDFSKLEIQNIDVFHA